MKILEILLDLLILIAGVLMIYAGIKYYATTPLIIGILIFCLGLYGIFVHTNYE